MYAEQRGGWAYPARREEPLHPPGVYRTWREAGPATRIVLPSGKEAWLVTRYDDVRRLLRGTGLSSDATRDGYPRFGAAVETPPLNRTFIGVDEPEHGRLRRMVAAEFTLAATRRAGPMLDEVAEECVARFGAGPAPQDLVHGYALPVASGVICRVLGVPYDCHEEFEHLTAVLTDGERSDQDKLAAGQGITELLRGLVRHRAAEPRDDLVSRLTSGPVASGELTEDEAIHNLVLLLGAGHDTSASMIALGAYSLLTDPSLRRRPVAVDELLRFHTIIQLGIARVATEDLRVGDQVIRAGEGVVLSLQTANRDPARFPDPDRIDPGRDNARQHLAFGFGAHQCIGHRLARDTLAVALPKLFDRLPGLRLAEAQEALPVTESMDFHGIRRLPVSW
ncbi:cytochrome P450 [Actinoplanes sp. NPDC049265]|uniref:cytochrome P450 n=1 Tax=Actinoplanes sp. NPDC049265 TaxID=3363902 RepID=UPI00371E1A82